MLRRTLPIINFEWHKFSLLASGSDIFLSHDYVRFPKMIKHIKTFMQAQPEFKCNAHHIFEQ